MTRREQVFFFFWTIFISSAFRSRNRIYFSRTFEIRGPTFFFRRLFLFFYSLLTSLKYSRLICEFQRVFSFLALAYLLAILVVTRVLIRYVLFLPVQNTNIFSPAIW